MLTQEYYWMIKELHEWGMYRKDIARKHGVSEQSIYRWQSKYGGMEISEAKRLKQLEEENRRLKRMCRPGSFAADLGKTMR